MRLVQLYFQSVRLQVTELLEEGVLLQLQHGNLMILFTHLLFVASKVKNEPIVTIKKICGIKISEGEENLDRVTSKKKKVVPTCVSTVFRQRRSLSTTAPTREWTLPLVTSGSVITEPREPFTLWIRVLMRHE